MADAELDKIRQQRLAQMQAQYGGGGPGGGNTEEQKKVQEERMRQQEDAKHSILTQMMDQTARARLNTLKMSKPEKGQMLENILIGMAQSRQIVGKIDDLRLVQILESINQQMPKSTSTVKFDRRRAAIDSDEDEYDL